MAQPPQTDQAFLREVDEELRREQLFNFARRWGPWLAGLIVLGLAALAGGLYWNTHRTGRAGEMGEQFHSAYRDLEEGKVAAAAKPLAELAGSDTKGYRAVAKFTQADILLQKKDLKAAAAKFAEIANDDTLAQPFRDLALIRQTTAEYDTLKPQVVAERLGPLAMAGSPWFGSAGEMVAVAYLRMGRRDAAGRLFGEIARDEKQPASLRQRAVQMAGVLGVDAVDQSKDKQAR